MGYGIPAAEFLGICILMADFDLQTDALQVVNRLEAFQREEHCRFGTSDRDFRGSLLQLQLCSGESYQLNEPEANLMSKELCQLSNLILQFDHVWFNDEGEDWQKLGKEEWPEERRDLPYWIDD